jgi:hypothetical protein
MSIVLENIVNENPFTVSARITQDDGNTTTVIYASRLDVPLRNAFVGGAGNDAATGGANVGIGMRALISLGAGHSNTAVGDRAMEFHTGTTGNTAVGAQALTASTGCTDCVAVGFQALLSAVSGVGATAVGRLALATCTAVGNNSAVGDSALRFTTTGQQNVAIGYRAAEANVTGSFSVHVGQGAALSRTASNECVSIGHQAFCGAVTSGHQNTAAGFLALSHVSGDRNTALGYRAMRNGSGSDNIAIGSLVAESLVSGSGNVFIGNEAGRHDLQKEDAVNTIVIGPGAFSTDDNQLVIGTEETSEAVLAGATFSAAHLAALADFPDARLVSLATPGTAVADPPAISAADPTGGTTIDVEARAELEKLIDDVTALRGTLIALIGSLEDASLIAA